MTNTLRWTMTLLALAALALGSTVLTQAIERLVYTHARTNVARQEVDSLRQRVARLREQAPHVEMWRETARLCRREGLLPDGWRSYPVSISRDLPWQDVAQTLLIASNALPRPGGYWFQPMTLRVARADVPRSPTRDGDKAGEQPVRPGAELFHIDFQGHFLVPTRNQNG